MKKVLIYTWLDTNNFGDRMGMFFPGVVLSPIPATYEFAQIYPMAAPKDPIESYDLVIYGTGNSLWDRILSGNNIVSTVFTLEKAKCVVGVFGLQFKERIVKENLLTLLGTMNRWYARSHADIEFAESITGEERKTMKKAYFLGEWQFLMYNHRRPILHDEFCYCPSTSAGSDPFDLIEAMQTFEQIVTNRLHCLVPALMSCRNFIYYEVPDGDVPNHKIGDVLRDVYHLGARMRVEPGKPFLNDLAAVSLYRRLVQWMVSGFQRYVASKLIGEDGK